MTARRGASQASKGLPPETAASAPAPIARTPRPAPKAAAQPLEATPLWELLQDRRWLRRPRPTRHVTASNVFKPHVYKAMADQFAELLNRPADHKGLKFDRNMRNYDAYGFNFPVGFSGPLAIFITRAWHDLVAGLFNVEASGHVNCGLHHHKPGGENGFLHNDLNPGHFTDEVSPTGVVLPRHGVVSYAEGTSTNPDVKVVEVVRAVALIFYLANPEWRSDDGGETGLYSSVNQHVEAPDVSIPPINNSLIAFECTPYSFHSFVTNRRSVRNSLVMWVHQPKANVVARWGEASIVRWK